SGLGYTGLGMQGALDALRSTGATNVATASGIDYANNLTSWLTNKPTDSLAQLMAETHVYGGNSCYTPTCLTNQDGAVLAAVPVVGDGLGRERQRLLHVLARHHPRVARVQPRRRTARAARTGADRLVQRPDHLAVRPHGRG